MAEDAYAREQARLQAELDGTPADENLRIEVPKDPEVNPQVWKDVEPMLYRGFVVVAAELGDDAGRIPVVFKSLNHHEYGLLSFLGDFAGAPPARFWNRFLAHAVFMFDGINVLADRDYWLPKLEDIFQNLPKGARDRVIRHLSELNRRASNAVRLTEAYVTEPASRYRWAQLRGLDLTMPAVTGITGTERLGMNWAQLTWRALNYFEDMREQVEREWDNAKFIGSCFAGKGLSKVYNQDNERRKKEREDRLAKKDALLQHVLLGRPLTDGFTQKYGATLVSARSVEDLARQMEGDLRGDKDFHDLVVDQYEQRQRASRDEQQRQLAELAEQREAEYQGRFLVGTTDNQGLTRAEVEQRMSHAKSVQSQRTAQRFVYPQTEGEEQFEQKWLGPSSEVGYSDKDPQSVPIVPAGRTRGTPFRR